MDGMDVLAWFNLCQQKDPQRALLLRKLIRDKLKAHWFSMAA